MLALARSRRVELTARLVLELLLRAAQVRRQCGQLRLRAIVQVPFDASQGRRGIANHLGAVVRHRDAAAL